MYPRTKFGEKQRSFNSSWYEQFKWLEYSLTADRAFCFPCRLFNNSSGINVGHAEVNYSKVGFNNWKNATSKFREHQLTKTHLNSTNSLTEFLHSKPIDIILDENNEQIRSQKEIQRLKNRQIMNRLIDITLCLGIGGRSFRGKNEKDSSFNKGLFKDIVTLLSKYDPLLKSHLDSGPKNSSYCSNLIQNDLILSVSNVIKNQFREKIRNQNVSIIADETSDIGHHEQLSVVIRYFDNFKKCPVEQFICMKRIMSIDSETIFNTLRDVISEYDIKWESVVSMCFDGAATMSGSLSGVQARFKEKNEKSLFVHCYGHCLNLILVDSVGRDNKVTFNFFGNIQVIYSFVEGSCTRHAVLEKIASTINIKLKTLKSVSTTRWACRAEAVSAIKKNYAALLIAIAEICDNTRQADVSVKGFGIINQMKTFEFIFSMQMLDPILNLVLKVSTYLQSPDLNLLTAVNLVTSLKHSLLSLRNTESEFQNIFKESVNMCEIYDIQIPDVKKRKVSSKIDNSRDTQHFMNSKEQEMKICVYLPLLDKMINGIEVRFNQETLTIIKSIGHLVELETNHDDVVNLCKTFDLKQSEMEAEIRLIEQYDPNPKGKNCGEWIKWLTVHGREDLFSNVFKAFKIFVTIPVTSCSCERTFSKLSFIKTKLRSTMNQDRLDGLLTINIEQELARNINFDDVIEFFKVLKPYERRMNL